MEVLDWIRVCHSVARISIKGCTVLRSRGHNLSSNSPPSSGPPEIIQHALEEEARLRQAVREQEEEEEAASEQEEARALEESCFDNRQYLPTRLVDINVPIQEAQAKLLNSKSLGLVGMGGVGKTTLAQAVFNQLAMGFEYNCYVPEVKLICGRVDDVKYEIWKSMHRGGKRIHQAQNWSLLRGKCLLLVLDDASERDLRVLFDIAEDLAPKSRFIVTCRDGEFLEELDDTYKVPFLNEASAKELFMEHAFRQQELPSELEDLVDAIVKRCEGLPITLQVVGNYSYERQKRKDWEEILEALDRAYDIANFVSLEERLLSKLRIIFDSRLREVEQNIFLDAATFFCGNCILSEAKVAWRAAYDCSEGILWRNLADMSFVYDVKDDEVILMREELLRLGRMMAEEPGYGRRLRVRTRRQALKLLQSANALHDQEIYALRLDPTKDLEFPEVSVTVTRSGLLSLKEVRYLHVHGTINIDGAQGDEMVPFLTNTVYLKCVSVGRHFTDVLFHSGLIRLVVLDLSYHEEEDLPSSFTELSRLKILKLSTCKQLKRLPEVVRLQNLEFVEIRNCRELKELPLSFGTLSKLRHLKIIECWNLHTLSESFGQLFALVTLQLHQCGELKALPDSFGRLSSLEHLELQCDLHELPESFGCLYSLRFLKFLYFNSVRTLPDSFGSLPSLYHLEFNSCRSLHSLPDSFGDLPKLRNLQFTECPMLHTLPETFGNLSSLTNLQFTECPELHTLPESFGDLSGLSDLRFRFCDNLHTLPESLGKLSALQHLQLEQCEALRALPNSFSQLMKLENLKLSFCLRIEILPESFAQLIALRHLRIEMVALTTVPNSIRRLSLLKVLEVGILPFVKVLPTWLGEPEAGLRKRSRKIFHVEDGNFALAAEHHLELRDQFRLVCGVHRRAMDLVKGLKFVEALATLNACNTHTSELQLQPRLLLFGASYKPVQLQVFFLQERGILKRLANDLSGALRDLNHAFEVSRNFNHFYSEHRYDCLKHRAYVKYLQGDLDGASRDAEEALSMRGERCDGSESAPGRKHYLGEDSVKFLKFQLK